MFISHFMLAVCTDSVILIVMIINEEYQSDENPNAELVVEAIMDQIATILIQPMHDKLTAEDQLTLGLVANALKVLGKKAQAYENLENGELPQDWKN